MKINKLLTIGLLTNSLILSACGNKSVSSGSSIHEHNWGTPTYVWAEDFSSCTAERVCAADENHKEKHWNFDFILDYLP